LWLKQFGVAGNTVNINSISIDGEWLYVAGSSTAAIDDQLHVGGYDIMIAKYSTITGERQWLRMLGTTTDDKATSTLVMTHNAELAVTGVTNGPLHGRPHMGRRDIWIGTWTPEGNMVDLTLIGTPDDDDSTSITQVYILIRALLLFVFHRLCDCGHE
jgi:hypothetical protein